MVTLSVPDNSDNVNAPATAMLGWETTAPEGGGGDWQQRNVVVAVVLIVSVISGDGGGGGDRLFQAAKGDANPAYHWTHFTVNHF